MIFQRKLLQCLIREPSSLVLHFFSHTSPQLCYLKQFAANLNKSIKQSKSSKLPRSSQRSHFLSVQAEQRSGTDMNRASSRVIKWARKWILLLAILVTDLSLKFWDNSLQRSCRTGRSTAWWIRSWHSSVSPCNSRISSQGVAHMWIEPTQGWLSHPTWVGT